MGPWNEYSYCLVFKSLVWSGLLTPRDKDRDCNWLTIKWNSQKTWLDQLKPVFDRRVLVYILGINFSFKMSPRTLNFIENWLIYVIFFSLLLFCVNFYCFIYFSTGIGPKNMILMSFWREHQALQNCRYRLVLTAKDQSFFSLWFSKIKRPDCGLALCSHRSGPVTVFLQSCDWTFKH